MGGASELWSPETELTFPFLGISPLLLLELDCNNKLGAELALYL